MVIYENVKVQDDRQLRALTGLSQRQFNQLLVKFTDIRERLEEEAYHKRKKMNPNARKPGGGRKGKLPTDEERLMFILHYTKVYPTFDVLAHKYDMSRSKAYENVYKLLPILYQSLFELNVIPHRKFNNVKDFKDALGSTDRILIDVTERAYRRSVDDDIQRDYYSGKKKQHTVKNTVISFENKFIFFLGQTFTGHNHDYTMLKNEFDPEHDWFSDVNVLVDSAYQGMQSLYQSGNISLPYKKPRKSKNNPEPKLTEKQKEYNKSLSKIRILVENAISGLKRFNILVHRFRNRPSELRPYKLEDLAISVCAGLWNLSLA